MRIHAVLFHAAIVCIVFQLIYSVGSAHVPADRKSEIEIWSAVSLDTTALGGLSEDEAKGRTLLLTGFRYARTLSHKNNFACLYTVDVIPVAVAFHSIVQKGEQPSGNIRKNEYGFGASPIGFQFHFRTNRAIQPQFGTSGGFLRFSDPVPTPASTRWNLTATVTAGVRMIVSHGRALDVGYMFHHISNGRSAEKNPSLNTNVIYFGFALL